MPKIEIPAGHIVYDDEGVSHGEGETIEVSASYEKELRELWGTDEPTADVASVTEAS